MILFPNLNDFREKLLFFGSDNCVSVYEIETFLRNFLIGKPLPVVDIAYQYYTRCSLNEPNEIFNAVKRCSFNPNLDSIKLQRCNYDRQQVFYCTVPISVSVKAHATAIMEVSREHIAKNFAEFYFVTLSRWVTSRVLNVYFFPDFQNLETTRISLEIEKNMRNIESFNQEEIDYFIGLFNVFSEIFSMDINKDIWYRISAAFYNCIIRLGKEQGVDIDGIVYSSANTGKIGTNMVLNKDLIIDGTLICDCVQMWIAKRDLIKESEFWIHPASDKVKPKFNENFKLNIYSEYAHLFNNYSPKHLL